MRGMKLIYTDFPSGSATFIINHSYSGFEEDLTGISVK
jgi:hypothetical protein